MKRHIMLGFLPVLLGMASCSGFLEETPLSNVTDKNYYQTESDAEGAVNAIYETVAIGSVAQWQGTGNANTPYGGVFFNVYYLAQDLMSDNALYDLWTYANLGTLSVDETDGNIKTLWYAFYRAVNTANVAIKKIPAIDMNVDRRNHLVAEARFWRGLLYGELAKMWGDVPLRKEPTEGVDELFSVTRENRVNVLNFALEDLKYAEENLIDNYRSGYGRATSTMATAVYAKIAMVKAAVSGEAEDWQKVADAAGRVIESHEYDLYPSFSDNFVIANKHGKEDVLSINYIKTSDLWGSQFNVSLLPAVIRQNSPGGDEGPINANSWVIPTADLYNSFEEGDTRRDVSIMSSYTYSDNSVLTFEGTAKYPYYFNKYWDRVQEPVGMNSDQNYPYMRYSEVLLLYAEALNEIGTTPDSKAYDALNKVRDRAFKDNGSGAHNLSGLTKDAFRKAVLDERRHEFVMEGSRWFDLVRMDPNFVQTIKAVKPDSYVAEKHKLFPIPQYDRLLNGEVTQNPGY